MSESEEQEAAEEAEEVPRRRRRRRCPSAGCKRKTRSPHSDVGKSMIVARLSRSWMIIKPVQHLDHVVQSDAVGAIL